MPKTYRILLSILLLVPMMAQAQQSAFVPPLKQMVAIPSSPEAAAMSKYGNTAVSQYTGRPSISIPLGEIAGRSTSLPIMLTYDASGIKVEQIASWVGLGWNLNLGGAITRKVNGLPDDYIDANPKYYPYYSDQDPSWTSNNDMAHYVDYYKTANLSQATHTAHMIDSYKDFIDDYNNSIVDTQPDSYQFSAMGISGTIFIDYSTSPISAKCLEHPEYEVVPSLSGSSVTNKGSRQLDSWTITDNQGNKYEFGKPETTELIDLDQQDDEFRDYYSAWYLTKFTSTNGVDVFDFNYSTLPVTNTNNQSLAGTASMPIGGSITTYDPKLKITQYELQSIDINDVRRLSLTMGSGYRSDLAGRKLIDKIQIYESDGNTSQNVIDLINDSYFDDGNTPLTEYNQRLKLDRVDILGANSGAGTDASLIKRYSFDYFGTDNIPSRLYLGQDFWGYNNGINTNTNLIPKHDTHYTNGANRIPNVTYMKEGSLQKITYPTGGTTEFFYQENYVPNPQGGAHLKTGGMRIYKIIDKASATETAQTRYFYYDELSKDDLNDLDDDFFRLSDASSGILQIPDDFEINTTTDTYDGTNWVTGNSLTLLASTRYKARNSIVTYSTVTELQLSGGETNGLTVYNFNNLANYSTTLSTSGAPLNGRLKSSQVYDNNRVLLQKKELEYATTNITGLQGYQIKSNKFQDYDGHRKKQGAGTSVYYLDYDQMATNSSQPYTSACSSCLFPGPTNDYQPETFYFQPRWIRLTSETSTSYEHGDSLTTTTSYSYDTYVAGSSHFEVVSTETKDDEQVVYTGFTYPQDLASGSNIYQLMVDDNRTGQVVGTITKRGGANGLTLQQQETTYTGSSASQLPDEVKYATNGGTLETRIEYESFNYGQPLSLIKDDHQNIQYLWDHNGTLPTAMVTGTLDNTTTRKYAYSSFETDEKGHWTYTGSTSNGTSNPSGTKVYNLNGGSVSRTSLATDETYILSFWAKGTGSVKIEEKLSTTTQTTTQAVSGTWTYYQFKVDYLDQVVISENSAGDNIEIDELRLYANGSQMTTYAYDGAGRLITQLGPNGIPIHYEYDMHGRLERVKDHEHNTLRLMEYEYKATTGN